MQFQSVLSGANYNPVTWAHWPFLSAFAKLRKATNSFLSVRLSARTDGTPMLPLDGNLIFEFFFKSVEKIQVLLNLTRITGTLLEDLYTFFLSYLAQFCLKIEIFQTKRVEKIETHFMSSTFFSLFLENRGVYEIMLKIFYSRAGHRWEYDACAWHVGYISLHTHTHTHRICNTYCSYTATTVGRTLPMVHYTYIACLVM